MGPSKKKKKKKEKKKKKKKKNTKKRERNLEWEAMPLPTLLTFQKLNRKDEKLLLKKGGLERNVKLVAFARLGKTWENTESRQHGLVISQTVGEKRQLGVEVPFEVKTGIPSPQ